MTKIAKSIYVVTRSRAAVDKRSEGLPDYLGSPLSLGAWLAPKMNAAHGVDLSKQFWSRMLLQYCRAALQQLEYYSVDEFQFPVSFQPVLGPRPPDAKIIRKDKYLSLIRACRTFKGPERAARSIPEGASIAIGIRGQQIAEAVDANFFRCNWLPHIFRRDRFARERLRLAARKEAMPAGKNIVENVPEIFVEFFSSLAKAVSPIAQRRIRRVYVEHFGSIFDRFLACLLSEGGAELVQMQTGGYVGETLLSISAPKRSEYDVLLTYGWAIGEQDRPFFAVRLHEFSNQYKKAQGGAAEIGVLAVYDRAESRETSDYYKHCTRALCGQLDRSKYPTIRLRPRGTTRLRSSRSSLLEYAPTRDVDLDDGKELLANLCSRSSVVVHWTHPSTNFLECIFVDQPVLSVWTEKKVTDIVRPYYEFFYNEGVLHETPESLISHLNSVYIGRWWSGVCGCPKYSEFKSKFARSREEFLSSGSDILSSIVQAG